MRVSRPRCVYDFVKKSSDFFPLSVPFGLIGPRATAARGKSSHVSSLESSPDTIPYPTPAACFRRYRAGYMNYDDDYYIALDGVVRRPRRLLLICANETDDYIDNVELQH